MKQKLWFLLFGFAAGGIVMFFIPWPKEAVCYAIGPDFYGKKGDIQMGVNRSDRILDISFHQKPLTMEYLQMPSVIIRRINDQTYYDLNCDGIADARIALPASGGGRFIRFGSNWRKCVTIDRKEKTAILDGGQKMKFTDRWRKMK